MSTPLFPPELFQKAVVITEGRAKFSHLGRDFNLTSPRFDKLDGLTVLIASEIHGKHEVFRSGEIGDATEAVI